MITDNDRLEITVIGNPDSVYRFLAKKAECLWLDTERWARMMQTLAEIYR